MISIKKEVYEEIVRKLREEAEYYEVIVRKFEKKHCCSLEELERRRSSPLITTRSGKIA